MEKTEIFICDCNSLDHTYAFWYDEDNSEVHFMPRLYQYKPFWERVKGAYNYIIGKKSRYGDYDSVIIKPEDAHKIKNYLDKIDYLSFLSDHPRVLKSGLQVFKDLHSLGTWLIFKDGNNPRMIDLNEESIILKLDNLSRGTYT